MAWSDIYPPLRYGKCLMAVREIGKLKLSSGTTRKEVTDYMRELALAAGIPYFAPNNLNPIEDRFDNCVNSVITYDLGGDLANRDKSIMQLYTDFTHFDFVYSCQNLFSTLQGNSESGAIIDLMLAYFRGQLPHFDRPVAVGDFRLGKCLTPPVIIDTSDLSIRAGSRLWPAEMTDWLVCEAAMETPWLDLLCSTGKIEFDARLSSTEQHYVEKLIVDTFGIRPW